MKQVKKFIMDFSDQSIKTGWKNYYDSKYRLVYACRIELSTYLNTQIGVMISCINSIETRTGDQFTRTEECVRTLYFGVNDFDPELAWIVSGIHSDEITGRSADYASELLVKTLGVDLFKKYIPEYYAFLKKNKIIE